MLDETSGLLEEKRADLVGRLNDKRAENSLPAELELAMFWMLRNEGDVELEPYWWSEGKKPDVYIDQWIDELPAIIEVTALGDNSLSHEGLMDQCAQKIAEVANQHQKGAGSYLYFSFHESGVLNRGRLTREVTAPKGYEVSLEAAKKIQHWLASDPKPNELLQLKDGRLSVSISKKAHKQSRYYNIHTSRPPRTYSETENQIYATLVQKAKQVREAASGTLRVIFLLDGGSRFLQEAAENRPRIKSERDVTAQTIIDRFLRDKAGSVDAVVLIVPLKRHRSSGKPQRRWATTVFANDFNTKNSLTEKMKKLVAQLPLPRFGGSNARALSRQGATNHKRSWNLGTEISWRRKEMTYKISSRALQDFLSRKIDERTFRNLIGDRDDGPTMKRFIEQGFTIKSASFEAGGVDKDDDYIVFEFGCDAAAAPFK